MSHVSDDPLARLENAVKAKDQEERASEMLSKARVRLLLNRDARCVFFSTLGLRLMPEIDWKIDTMAVNGRELKYNPGFVVSQSQDVVMGCVVHEVMHCALRHHARRGYRDLNLWNIACDLAINPLVREANFVLPKEALFPGVGQYALFGMGLSAEEYYDHLRNPPKPNKDKEQGQGGGGQGQGQGEPQDDGQDSPEEQLQDQPGDGEGDGGQGQDPGGCGGVQDAGDGSPAEQRESESDWEVATIQAHEQAKKRGSLSAGLDRLVEAIKHPKVDWKEVLREFINQQAKNDYSWSLPNRRFIHIPLYLPSPRSEELGSVVVAVDTSGSIGPEEIQRFGSECAGILEAFDSEMTIIYHDAKVCHVQHWKSSDGPLVMEPKGGGGTSHVPVFEWIDEHMTSDPPTCLVCFTDLMSFFPARGPEYPVLWCSTVQGEVGPFGQTVEVEV